jgi:hypothetical protein
MRIVRAFLLVVLCAAALAGCRKPEREEPMELNYEAPLPPGQLALRRITDYRQIPDFAPACTDLAGLREAIAGSLNYLAKPSSRKHFPYGTITHDQAVASLKAFLALVESKPTPA